jgi:hypothetical protein
MEARVTHRQNIDGPHEPYHRLVKLRTAVLTHHFGRTYRLACGAFERVEEFCARIAGACREPQEEKETEKDAQATSAPELTTASEGVEQDDVPAAADDTKDRPEAEPTTTTEMSAKSDKSDDVPTAADDGVRDGTEAEPTVAEVPSEGDKADDVPAAADGPKNETDSEAQDKEGKEVVSQDSDASPAQAQPQNGDLPTCGNCSGSLSFPFWYCIFCEGQSVPSRSVGRLKD